VTEVHTPAPQPEDASPSAETPTPSVAPADPPQPPVPTVALPDWPAFPDSPEALERLAKRYTLTLSLVVIDIDAFGKYNEACGQMLGNLALSDMASILIKGTREVDFVARIGGDEFALVLPETNRLGALQLTERLRSEVASYPFPLPEDVTSLNITVSAGISNFTSAAGVDGDLLATAHIALDHARAQGPDTIKLWDEKLEEEQ